jgi:hypothetical protein
MASCSVVKRSIKRSSEVSGAVSGVVSGVLSSATLATLLLGGVFSPQAVRAEGASGLQDIGSGAASDPFSGRGDNSSGVMQLIHRVMQGEGNIDRAEQRAAQKENVNEATSDFFTKQRERLKAAGSVPGTSSIPQPSTPGALSVGTPGANTGANGLNSEGSTSPLVITAPVTTPVTTPVTDPIAVPVVPSQATPK